MLATVVVVRWPEPEEIGVMQTDLVVESRKDDKFVAMLPVSEIRTIFQADLGFELRIPDEVPYADRVVLSRIDAISARLDWPGGVYLRYFPVDQNADSALVLSSFQTPSSYDFDSMDIETVESLRRDGRLIRWFRNPQGYTEAFAFQDEGFTFSWYLNAPNLPERDDTVDLMVDFAKQ